MATPLAQPHPSAVATPSPPLATTAPPAAPAPASGSGPAALTSPSAPPAQAGAAGLAAARVELPSSDADYLKNPKPAYPPLSRRQHEQGKVVLRVLIGVEGRAQKAEIHQSSGFERLDQAALATVLQWRYLPGKRGGVPEAMWFNVPINFVLE